MNFEDLVQNLRLECKICYERYGDNVMPKILHCSHSFCTECVQRLIDNSVQKESNSFRCPCCRKRNKFQTSKGVDSFKDNIDLRNVASVVPSLQTGEPEQTPQLDSVQPDLPKDSKDFEAPPQDDSCAKHNAKLTQFCSQCSQFICPECVLSAHYDHVQLIYGVEEYAEKVKTEMEELLELAQGLPFLRIRAAAEKTRRLTQEKRDKLLKKLQTEVNEEKSIVEEDLIALEEVKDTLREMGTGALVVGDGKTNAGIRLQEEEMRKSLRSVSAVLTRIENNNKRRSSFSPIGMEFVGMRPDGSVGEFIKGRINVIDQIVDNETIYCVADNRKNNSTVMIGVDRIGENGTSKWILSFLTEDITSPVVTSSQIFHGKANQRLLLIGLAKTIYIINAIPGKCVADQIGSITLKNGIILLEEASSINGIDWLLGDQKYKALVSFNTLKSMYIIDMNTRTLVKSISTSMNPSIISCRMGVKGNLVIVSDHSSGGKLSVLNQNGNEEFRLHPSKNLSGYLPWVSCWIKAVRPVKVAVVWCKPSHWKIAIHDGKGKVVQELTEQKDTNHPVSIAYNEDGFVICSCDGTKRYPYVPKK